MLVLTRHVGERLVVILEDGREILVEVCQVYGPVARPRVSVGLTADRTIKILREELLHTEEPAIGYDCRDYRDSADARFCAPVGVGDEGTGPVPEFYRDRPL